MRKRVYIETTIVSYLTAKPSRDVIRLAHQEITRQWWERHRVRHDLCLSQFVLDEAGDGDPQAAAQRIQALKGLAMLAVTEEARELAKVFVREKLIPRTAVTDALHLAVTAVHEVDVLLTWNCRHLANAMILRDLGRLVRAMDYEMPIVCTPEELMGGDGHD